MHASDVRHGGQKNSVKAQNVREAHLTVPGHRSEFTGRLFPDSLCRARDTWLEAEIENLLRKESMLKNKNGGKAQKSIFKKMTCVTL